MRIALSSVRGFEAKIVTLVAALTLLSSAQPVSAKPLHARTSGVDVQVGESIQAAIDAAQPGSTITVSPGIYAEQLTISKDGITLAGGGAILVPPLISTNNTCTDLAGNSTNAAICITGSGIELAPYITEHRKLISVAQPVHNISITGFQIWNSTGENIAVVGGQNIQILNNAVYNGKSYGILSVGSIDVLIANNTVITQENVNFIAICTDNNILSTNISGPTQVSQNTISGYYVGLCIQTPKSLISANDVSSCCIGAFLDPGVTAANVMHNHIAGTNPVCASISPSNGGIFIDGARDAIVQSNVVTGQNANGTAAGIVLVDAYDVNPPVVAVGNTVVFNVLSGNDYDVFVNSTGMGNVVEDNICESSGDGCA